MEKRILKNPTLKDYVINSLTLLLTFVISITLFLFVISCGKNSVEKEIDSAIPDAPKSSASISKRFVIYEGNHDSNPTTNQFLHWKPNGMNANVWFDHRCSYNTGDPSTQGDWNKLMGIWSGTSKNTSIRWAWRWNVSQNVMELCPFVHRNNEYGYEDMGGKDYYPTVGLEENFFIQIDIEKSNNRYKMTFVKVPQTPDIRYIYDDLSGDYNGFCIRNYLWFGGQATAPHTMAIEVDGSTW